MDTDNVATPENAELPVVPESVPELGLVPMETLIWFEYEVTKFSPASYAPTDT